MLTLVDQPQKLTSLAERLPQGSTFCLDTEFDSRADRTILCLLQLCVVDQTYLIDSIALRDLSPLAPALGHPDATWVLHGGHQDIPLLRRALGLSNLPHLFDTQIAWGLASPESATSFTYLTYKLLGSRNSKQHQTDDWTRRPLSNSQLAYAAHDVDCLPQLYEILIQRAAELGRHEQVLAACYEHLCGTPESPEPISLESYRNAWQLEPTGQFVLRELIAWYNDLSPGEREKTLEAKLLWSLANRLPTSVEALRQVRGMPRRLDSLHQDRIISIVKTANQAVHSSVNLLEPLPYATYERLQLDAWLEYVRATACAKAQVSKELVLAGRRLRQLKEAVAKDGLGAFESGVLKSILGTWQHALIGEALIWAAGKIESPAALEVPRR